MIHMNRIDDYTFPVIDRMADSYFEEQKEEEMLTVYHFSTLPELRHMLQERLGGSISEQEILEVCRNVFRSKPSAVQEAEDIRREVVDFIYEL